jgi:hypothetical protein
MVLDGFMLSKLFQVLVHNGLFFKLKIISSKGLEKNIHIILTPNSGMMHSIESAPSKQAIL